MKITTPFVFSEVFAVRNYKLSDDGTPFGGVSFIGETVIDFLESCYDSVDAYPRSVYSLNSALIENGINPIYFRF